MSKEIYGIFSFSSSHYAIAAEVAAGKDYSRLIPLPPEVSAGCGLVLRVKEDAVKKTIECLQEADIPYEEVFRLIIEDKKRSVEKYDLL